MEIKEYFSATDREHWLTEIKKSGWGAGQFLWELLRDGRFRQLCGKTARVYLLTDGEELISFCTLAELDDVRDTDLGPWIGFVYTFPAYRGHRHAGKLLEHAFDTAVSEGAERVYISTGHTGLYEKYGYTFCSLLPDMNGELSRIYVWQA